MSIEDIIKSKSITVDVLNQYKNDRDLAISHYDELIKLCKGREEDVVGVYTEKHHIKPRCLGGDSSSENLVHLTYIEHVIAHILLHYIYLDCRGLALTMSLMIKNVKKISIAGEGLALDLESLNALKSDRSKVMLGDLNPMKNLETAKKAANARRGKPTHMKGKHHSPETRRLISEKVKALNLSGERHPMYGKKHSAESINKMSRSHLGKKLGPLSEKQKEFLSEIHKRRVIYMDGTVYNSVSEAAEVLGIHRSTLSKYLNKYPEKGYKYL